MVASSAATGDDGPAPRYTSTSASSMVFTAATGTHVLKIAGYLQSKISVPTGQIAKSRSFRVGGRSWHVQYSPNGRSSGCADSISLYLALDDTIARAANARARISLLDHAGEPVPPYVFHTGAINFFEKKVWGYEKFIQREALEKSAHLRGDSFSVGVDVTVMEDARPEDAPAVAVPPPDMHRHLGDLLASKEGADVKFRVRRKIFPAHRSVLAARSPVFKKALLGPMKEGTTSKTIPIDDMEAKVFEALLTFVYTDALPEMKKKEESAMVQHLLVAADRYDMERLKLICEDKLCKTLDTGSAATILVLAEQHNCRGLKEACFKFLGKSANLNAFMETEGFEYLTKTSPSALKQLMSANVQGSSLPK